MKKNIFKVIGTLIFLTLIFFNVQFIFNDDNNGEKVDLKFVQSEALAVQGWYMENYQNGCRCEQSPFETCDVSAQCVCNWGNCECCIKAE